MKARTILKTSRSLALLVLLAVAFTWIAGELRAQTTRTTQAVAATQATQPTTRPRDDFSGASRTREQPRDVRSANRPQTQPAQPSTNSPSVRVPEYNERYAVLSQKNVFLRNRRSFSSGRPGGNGGNSSSQNTPRTPEQSYILTGIAIQDGRNVAFIEGGGTVQRLEIGSDIARGRIVTIELDYLEYESNGRRTRVDIGRNLAGGASVAAASAPTTQGAGSGPALDPNDPSLTIEQRMRLRAQRDRGQ